MIFGVIFSVLGEVGLHKSGFSTWERGCCCSSKRQGGLGAAQHLPGGTQGETVHASRLGGRERSKEL